MELLFSYISIILTLLGVLVAYFTFRKNSIKDQRKSWINEGTMLSDIGYIKASVDRMEENLKLVEERYQVISERLAKLEAT